MRLDFEGAGPTVADVDDPGIFARALDNALAFSGQPPEMHAAGFVRAVLAPHYAEDPELGEGGDAAQSIKNAAIFFRSDAVSG